jgi:UDP-N-acetylglucosamine--N-acetylmuramyl-(pentapeptide) pyrophosphoryl-undecaprenol N-acetylglucosamine transferase
MRNFMFPFRLIASMLKAGRVIRDFKPDLVIGTGGFASGPVLRVANRRHIPTLIQEQNSFPGVTNRLLAKKVSRICVAYPDMDRYFPAAKIVVTGNPVRTDIRIPDSRIPEAKKLFNLNTDRPVVLIFGGSQGARTLNQSLLVHIDQLAKAEIEVIWQTGTSFIQTAKSAVESCKATNIRALEFIYEMNLAYALAGLVVCRSGAITLSELSILGKPAILVPLPSAAENHQAKNAQAYVDAGAAVLVNDQEAPDRLVNTLLDLVNDPDSLHEMSDRMIRFAKPNAVKEIATEALKLLPTTDN